MKREEPTGAEKSKDTPVLSKKENDNEVRLV